MWCCNLNILESFILSFKFLMHCTDKLIKCKTSPHSHTGTTRRHTQCRYFVLNVCIIYQRTLFSNLILEDCTMLASCFFILSGVWQYAAEIMSTLHTKPYAKLANILSSMFQNVFITLFKQRNWEHSPNYSFFSYIMASIVQVPINVQRLRNLHLRIIN